MGAGWLQRVGLAIDELLNVLVFNGRPDQTISLHAAISARGGKRWACVLCRLLSLLVERDHCEKQFQPGPTPLTAALRAATCLAVLVLPFIGALHLLAMLLGIS